MGDQAHQFLLASGKLQALCYKEEIESTLRTPGMGGFDLHDLYDFPGQGTALVGVLDPFWESKGAREFSRFCNSTVPLARLSKRVFTTAEKLEADLEVAHFGPNPMEQCEAVWSLVDDHGKKLATGKTAPKTVPVDNGTSLGSIAVDLSALPAPARYKLVVGLAGTKFENDWDVWVYPPTVDTHPEYVLAVDDLTPQAVSALDAGGKVLLTIPPCRVKNAEKKVALGFSSIFWNTAWTGRQSPTTLGILCDPKSPALAKFPTDYHSNWQWWYLISHASPMITDDLPPSLHPTIQVIDDWVTAHKLGLVFEAKLSKGKLLVCSIDLKNSPNLVSQQFLRSLVSYMESSQFQPVIELTPGQVAGLLTSPAQ